MKTTFYINIISLNIYIYIYMNDVRYFVIIVMSLDIMSQIANG